MITVAIILLIVAFLVSQRDRIWDRIRSSITPNLPRKPKSSFEISKDEVNGFCWHLSHSDDLIGRLEADGCGLCLECGAGT